MARGSGGVDAHLLVITPPAATGGGGETSLGRAEIGTDVDNLLVQKLNYPQREMFSSRS